ncbi:MAG TPA: beta-1,3-glucanase family protein [Solirubrobacterales bacterium]|nr:beta-1,3-glucanase family protein [Solirubrobacterales bacterium]
MRLVRSRSRRALVAAAGLLTALALPTSASALTFHIVNESGRPANEVFVNIVGDDFNVPGFTEDVPVALSSIPNGEITINKIIGGRVYIEYGRPLRVEEKGIHPAPDETIEFHSHTRFDWAELTVNRPEPGQTPEEVKAEEEAAEADVANLTAVDQFAIGMRLTTFAEGGNQLESIGSTYADDVVAALQKVPGGPESTIYNGAEFIRVLSPLHSTAYPLLTEYVHSMAGQTITLHSIFDGIKGKYSGTFQPDGSIEISGEDSEGHTHSTSFTAEKLVKDIYTDEEIENTLEGELRHDVLAAFSLGLWGGKYGNDAINFCTNPMVEGLTEWCPNGFNVPAFAAARTAPEPYPTYEQYAATISELGNFYGNPFSDASQQVTVGIAPEHVNTLQLTILPDSPSASGGGGNGGPSSTNSAPASPPAPSKAVTSKPPASRVTFKLAKAARFEHGKLEIGKLVCGGACGKVSVLLRPAHGKGVIARLASTVRKKSDTLVLKPTKAGARLIAAGKAKQAKLTITVTQPGHAPATKQTALRITG